VKFLHPQYVSSEEVLTRFQREAQAAAVVGHENIIEVTDMGQTSEGAPYIVMEYLSGGNVQDLLDELGILPLEQAAHIMAQALSALKAAHDAGIIHRDLKPENIYLIERAGEKDYVKLLDFGISKFKLLEGEEAAGLTQTGTVLGTPYYMSPEQARGEQNIGPASDIYAMGVILFQMMTGRLPFEAPNYNALLIKILTEDPPDPLLLNPKLPLDIVETIKIAMARDAKDRFADCIDFRRRLLGYVPGASSAFHSRMTFASESSTRAAPSSTSATRGGPSSTSVTRAAFSATATPLEMTRSSVVRAAPPKRRLPLIIGAVSAGAAVIAVALYFIFAKSPENKLETTSPAPSVSVAASQSPGFSRTAGAALKKTPSAAAASAAPAAAVSPEKSPVPEVSIKLQAEPKNARISIDGDLTVGNLYENVVPKDDALHKIEITAEGFEPVVAEIRFNRDQALVYTLSELKKENAHRERKAKKTSHRKMRSSRKTSASRKAASEKKAPSAGKRLIDVEDPWK
jgi:eukaryotic-like serine/threonine-protein kinase